MSESPAANQKALSSSPTRGARFIQRELLCLPVNREAADMFAKWPILAE